MNLELEKRERVTKGSKGRDEIRSKIAKVTGILQICLQWIAWENSLEDLVDREWQLEKGRYVGG